MAEQPHRPLFQWHRSTVAIAGFVAACLALIEVPGQTSNTYYLSGYSLQEHGWPFVHLRRFVERPSATAHNSEQALESLKRFEADDLSYPDQAEPGSPLWSDLNNWRLFSGHGVWYAWSLITNLLICAATLLSIGALLEWRRRQRKSILQFTIADLIVALSFFGVVVALYKSSATRVQREYHARQVALEGRLFDFPSRDLAPGWLTRLTDNNRFLRVKLDNGNSVPIGWRTVEIKIRDQGTSFVGQPSPAELSTWLSELRSVNTISHWIGGPVTLKILDHYPPEQIKELRFFPVRCKDFTCVNRFTNIEALTFRGVDLEAIKFDYPQLPKLSRFSLDAHRFSEGTIEWLATLPELKEVHPWSTGELDKGLIEKLHSRLPNVVIRDRQGTAIP